MCCGLLSIAQDQPWRSVSFRALVVFCLAVVTSHHAAAHGPISGDLRPGGIAYRWTFEELEIGESYRLVGHVGAFSWRDPVLAGQAMPGGDLLTADQSGWSHNANWVQFTLSQPSRLTITLERQAGVTFTSGGMTMTAGDALVPALSLYEGIDNDLSPFADPFSDEPIDNWHVFNNAGNMSWAEDLSFLENEPNADGLSSVTRTFLLAPGDYSLALGGNPPPDAALRREGMAVRLTVTVPEPASWALLAIGAIAASTARRLFSRFDRLLPSRVHR